MGTGEGPSVGRRIGVLREQARLSRRELGQLAGVSHAYIGKLERGEVAYPSGARLDAIARALGWQNYHALLESDTPRPTPQEPWTVEVRGIVAELRELLLRAEAREAALDRLVLAVLEHDRQSGGRAAGAPG